MRVVNLDYIKIACKKGAQCTAMGDTSLSVVERVCIVVNKQRSRVLPPQPPVPIFVY